MKFLVTGAGGQLGQEWTRFLSGRKAEYTAYNSEELDITNFDRVEEVLRKDAPDVVINCAAYTWVDQAEKEPDKAFLINETGVRYLLDACRTADAKLVHYSTDYVFPGKRSDSKRYPDGYPEHAETGPVNIYGKSKLAGEIVLEKSGIHWLMIRVSWLCGADGNNFVKTMIRLAGERDSLNVVNDQTGSPSFTLDVVEKTFGLLQKGEEGIYHISSSGKISWAEFAKEIFLQTGQQVVVNEVSSSEFKTTAKRPGFSLLCNSKITDSGFRQVDWKKGLRELILQLENQ